MKLKNYLLLTLITSSVLFTGCSNIVSNGVEAPDRAGKLKRMHYKIYVDNKLILEKEDKLLHELKKKFISGLGTNTHYILKNGLNQYINDPKEYAIAPLKNKLIIYAGITKSNPKNVKQFEKAIEINKGYIKLKHNFKIKDRKLISQKIYSNKYEIVLDYLNTCQALTTYTTGYLAKNMATDILFLDGEMLNKNKLALIPATKIFSVARKTKEVLNSYGYQVVSSSYNADKIINLNLYGLTYLRNIKSNLDSIGTQTSLANSSMVFSKAKGNSSSTSMGIGAAVFALELLGTSNVAKGDRLAYLINAEIYDSNKKIEDEKSEIILGVKDTTNLSTFAWNYFGEKIKGDKYYSSTAASLIKFMETGKTKNKNDVVLKVSEQTKKGFLK